MGVCSNFMYPIILFVFCIQFLFILPGQWEDIILFFGIGINIYLIKQNSKKLKYSYSVINPGNKAKQNKFLTVNHPFFNLIELHFCMIARSPRLKYQAIIIGVLTLTSMYLALTKTILTEKFEIQIILISMIFSFSALTLNQYLFSAESSFFDRLTLLPTFQSLLKSRYIEYLLFTVFLFLVLSLLQLILRKNDWVTVATYVYNIGVIIPLSFGSIFLLITNTLFQGSNRYGQILPKCRVYIFFFVMH